MKKAIKWLFLTALLLNGSAVWAQGLLTAKSSSVKLEISDLYGDKQFLPLVDGMTLYWPQDIYNVSNGQRTFAVICDKDGKPVQSIPISLQEFAYLKFLGAPASSAKVDMTGYQDSTYDYSQKLRFFIDDKNYDIAIPGELRFSSPLNTYELITGTGKRYTIPMAKTNMIQYQDTIQGIGGYLTKMAAESQIYYWAFNNGFDYTHDYLHSNFYAMIPEGSHSNFSLLVPSDSALSYVPNIISFTSQKPTMINLMTNPKGYGFPIMTGKKLYLYDLSTGEIGSVLNLEQVSQTTLTDYLSRLLRAHTFLHEDAAGFSNGNDYYLAMDGTPIHVIREGGRVVGFQSPFHLWNQEKGLTTMSGTSTKSLVKANITNQRTKGNGTIYSIDNTLEATPRSVYSVLSGTELTEGAENPFRKFFELCDATSTFVSRQTQGNAIFISNGGLYTYGLNYIGNVPFTLYVPTNEAIQNEQAQGHLPTVSELEALSQQRDESEEQTNYEVLDAAIAAKIKQITDFVRAHIQFGVEIADQQPFDHERNTVLIKEGSLSTPHLRAKGLGQGKMTVTDECGNTRNILDAHKNIFVREVACIIDQNGTYDGKYSSPQGRSTLNNIVIQNAANGIIHQIDGVLSYKK